MCSQETVTQARGNPSRMVLEIAGTPPSLCLTDAACSLCSQGALRFSAQIQICSSLETYVEGVILCLILTGSISKKDDVKNWLISSQARFPNKLRIQQGSLGRGSQAEHCGHKQHKIGRFFRKADFGLCWQYPC